MNSLHYKFTPFTVGPTTIEGRSLALLKSTLNDKHLLICRKERECEQGPLFFPFCLVLTAEDCVASLKSREQVGDTNDCSYF